jgi:hypothetical protein
MKAPFQPKPDPHAAALTEALMLRVACQYISLRDKAEHAGADVTRHPPLGNAFKLSEQYEELLREWVDQRPETGAAALARIDLAREILLREISDDNPVIDERLDRVHAVELLAGVADWANERAIAELVEEAREARR